MMRVLMVSPFGGNTGGIARWTSHMVEFYEGLRRNNLDNGVELEVLSTSRSIDMSLCSSKLKRIIYGVIFSFSIFFRIRKKVKQGEFNVLHITTSASYSVFRDLVLLVYLKLKKQPVVLHYRFGRIPELAEKHNWEWRSILKCVRLATKVIVIDKMSYKVLLERGFNNICYLPNPVSPRIQQIINKNSVVDREKGFILFVGHALKTKGVYELVEACRQISCIKVKIVGTINEEIKNELQAMAIVRDNGKWLEIVGNCSYEDVIKNMCKCDIFVFPTYTEGFPNVILESMACGCAIIASAVGAIPEMLEETNKKIYGVLIKPRSSQQVKDNIENLINNEALKEEMRRNVIQRVNERYNIDTVWWEMVSIWKQIIK